MTNKKIQIYERDDGKYMVGLFKGVKEERYLFREACIINNKDVEEYIKSGMDFDDAVRLLYKNEKDLGNRELPRTRLGKIEPKTIDLLVE
ncbi:Uncharacterised protein [uncultured archaeon]|nr:Uncharacterised protein [uncultured archaeon]